MKAERQYKEPPQAESMQSKRERSKLSFVDNRPQIARQTKLIQFIHKKENKTVLSDDLKEGVENLSGFSMDDVRVHYNSDKPAQLNALAYAQGTDIHVGPEQEKHLPHEGWHGVQQKQGCVNPTIQRRVGFEFQTNLLLRDQKDRSPELRVPLWNGPLWHIECDQGELEFITEAFSRSPDLVVTMNQIVKWAKMLGDIPYEVPKERIDQANAFLASSDLEDKEIGEQIMTDNERRNLNNMEECKGTLLENLFVVGNAKNITAAPQTTIGIPLDKIISSLYLIALAEITLNEGNPNSKTVMLGSQQEKNPVLIPSHTSTVLLVMELRDRFPFIGEDDWRKLEGIIGLTASYIRSAHRLRNPYSYIKMMASLMSRVNFSAIYKALPNSVQPFFTPEIVAKAADSTSEDFVFGPKKAIKDITGPTIAEWISSIIEGCDALSPLAKDDSIIKGSESMGQYNELDRNDKVYSFPLVPIELREISKGVPLDLWPELAFKIMAFSNALLKSKFY